MSGRELHPVLTLERRRALMEQGIDLFHRGEYFAAHEAWEEIWRSTTPEPRDLFQGLVQLAAAFHHLHERKRPDVARRVLEKAERRLAAVAPRAVDLDVAALLVDLEAWDAWLAAPAGPSPPPPQLRWQDSSG
jgi:predicted metal-dependent hydrolase